MEKKNVPNKMYILPGSKVEVDTSSSPLTFSTLLELCCSLCDVTLAAIGDWLGLDDDVKDVDDTWLEDADSATGPVKDRRWILI